MAGAVRPAMPGNVFGSRQPDEIVARVAAVRARNRVRFRAMFLLTWAVLIGGLAFLIVVVRGVDEDFIATWYEYILGGVGVTVFVAVASIVVAVVFAVLGALGRLSSHATIYSVATLYVSLVRGTPLIVQIIFVYSALPEFGIVLPSMVAGIFALAFNYGAYMTETFRAGIQAIPRGQIEAAHALGLTERDILRRVVLPQAIRIVIPPIGNDFISMIKDSALVSYVAIQELFWRARTVGVAHFRTFEALILAALVYWLLTIVLSLVQERMEQRLAESDRRV